MKQNNNFDLDVKVRKLPSEGKLKAFASVNIGGAFAVKGIRIIEGNKGLFVAMPSQKNHKGEYEDMFFPITKESREAMQNAVLAAYEKSLQMSDNQSQEQKSVPEMSM